MCNKRGHRNRIGDERVSVAEDHPNSPIYDVEYHGNPFSRLHRILFFLPINNYYFLCSFTQVGINVARLVRPPFFFSTRKTVSETQQMLPKNNVRLNRRVWRTVTWVCDIRRAVQIRSFHNNFVVAIKNVMRFSRYSDVTPCTVTTRYFFVFTKL